jgi:uncharacterized protein YjiS (DUF1127 family)
MPQSLAAKSTNVQPTVPLFATIAAAIASWRKAEARLADRQRTDAVLARLDERTLYDVGAIDISNASRQR